VAAAAEQEAGRAHRVWGDQDAAGAAGGSIFGVVMVVVCVYETAKEPPTPERDPAVEAAMGGGGCHHRRRRQGKAGVEEGAAGEGERGGRRMEVWARGVGGRDARRLGRCGGRELKLTRLK
jgi:hypothetical protein